MSSRTRWLVVLQVAGAAALAGVIMALVGLTLLHPGPFGPRRLFAVILAGVAAAVVIGSWILTRWLEGPLERLLAAAARLGSAGGLPPLGPPGEEGGLGLARAALAFERTAADLTEERRRLAAKVAELEAANAELAEAREGMLRTERMATVGRLAAGIAHEIGNPLGAIDGFAELARGKLAAGEQAVVDDFLARIGAETQRIDAIVRDLLDFARPSELVLGPVSVAGAVEAAARLARVQARARDVAVTLALPPDLPPVQADERRLAQVFLNLILNAADAMGGQGEVRVSGAAAAGRVVVDVDDTGPGIPEAIRGRVFDPFFSTKEPGQGTGLGLAVCHGMMESFGGAIEAVPRPPPGARLRLSLRSAG